MSKLDITLAIIILVGAYSGFRDGFRVELFSLIAVFLGVIVGFKLMGTAMVYLEEEFFIDEFALPYIAFGAVFFLVVFCVNLAAKFIMTRFPDAMLGLADPYAGAFCGLLRTTFMVSLVLWLLDSMKLHFPDDWVGDSWIFPLVADFAPDTFRAIGSLIPLFSDIVR